VAVQERVTAVPTETGFAVLEVKLECKLRRLTVFDREFMRDAKAETTGRQYKLGAVGMNGPRREKDSAEARCGSGASQESREQGKKEQNHEDEE
jgi:hypothetical protein